MTQPLVLIGGGEHARVVADAARSRPDLYQLRGFVDVQPCDETVRRFQLPRLGDESALPLHGDAFALIAFGAVSAAPARMAAAARLVGAMRGFATLVHARAWVSDSAELEPGVVVLAGALVQTGARVGAHAIVNTGAIVEHDVEVGAFAHLAPGATTGGGARIGEGAFVGLRACIRDHVTIGSRAVIGMGAVVVADVPDGATVKGIPAR